ncbi:unnamed protein product [Urochloa humidicola]
MLVQGLLWPEGFSASPCPRRRRLLWPEADRHPKLRPSAAPAEVLGRCSGSAVAPSLVHARALAAGERPSSAPATCRRRRRPRSRSEPFSDAEIKDAFRRKAMEYHPDQNQNNKEAAEAKFKEIMDSYEAIKSERRNRSC